MLRFLRNVWLVNTTVIMMTIVLSLLTVYWHHQMYQLYKVENKVKKESQIVTALNKQLLMERSELMSGISVYEKSQQILLMHSPEEMKSIDL